MAYYTFKSYKLRVRPFEIFQIFKEERNCFFLDSSLNSNYTLGRFSFLGIDPFYILETKNQDPFRRLRELLEKYKISASGNPLPFLGGAVGYLAYDLGFALEKKLKPRDKLDSGIPDCTIGFYNTIIIIDHLKGLLYICSVGFPEEKYHLQKSLCEKNFKKIHKLLNKAGQEKSINKHRKTVPGRIELKSNFSKEDYLRAIIKAKRYIREGDIYQVNLSHRFETQVDLSAFEIYRRLRRLSPTYFSTYFDAGEFQILSSSPERFLRLEGDTVITRPMKGTRPRSKNRLKDQGLKQELWKSPKDKAELMMIVDLERNDLGKVCNYNSIEAVRLRELEEYSTVFQTTANISGRLHRDKDRIDLLRACFPGGSITGCPKIRAMEIIDELEPTRRGIYTGSLGYLSFSGNMDFNILIRTILRKKNELCFGVGGGIVTDSNPEGEYQETLVKARGMIKAIT